MRYLMNEDRVGYDGQIRTFACRLCGDTVTTRSYIAAYCQKWACQQKRRRLNAIKALERKRLKDLTKAGG
jgi:hypothetical protein